VKRVWLLETRGRGEVESEKEGAKAGVAEADGAEAEGISHIFSLLGQN